MPSQPWAARWPESQRRMLGGFARALSPHRHRPRQSQIAREERQSGRSGRRKPAQPAASQPAALRGRSFRRAQARSDS